MMLRTFDPNVVAELMENSEILEQAILYVKNKNPNLRDDLAKETAIRTAQEFCQQKWKYNSSGDIYNERDAFKEFVEDVKRGKYFSTTKLMCPNCKSTDIEETNGLVRLMSRNIWNGFKGCDKYECKSCHYKWS